MRRTTLGLLSLLMVASVWLARTSPAQTEDPGIEPEAQAIIKSMCDYLKGLDRFEFACQDWTDHVLESGQKLQYTHRRRAIVDRPSHIWAEATGDLKNRAVWKEGKSLSVASKDHQVYGRIEVPEDLDEAADFLVRKYDMYLPLSDMLSADPYRVFTERVKDGFYVGLTEVGGRPCHHLAFSQERVDWQMWVDAEGDPTPRRIVITYKDLPSHPVYAVTITELKGLDQVDASTFRFEPPAGYEEIEVVAMDESDGGR